MEMLKRVIWLLYGGERIRVMRLNLKAVKRRRERNGGNVQSRIASCVWIP